MKQKTNDFQRQEQLQQEIHRLQERVAAKRREQNSSMRVVQSQPQQWEQYFADLLQRSMQQERVTTNQRLLAQAREIQALRQELAKKTTTASNNNSKSLTSLQRSEIQQLIRATQQQASSKKTNNTSPSWESQFTLLSTQVETKLTTMERRLDHTCVVLDDTFSCHEKHAQEQWKQLQASFEKAQQKDKLQLKTMMEQALQQQAELATKEKESQLATKEEESSPGNASSTTLKRLEEQMEEMNRKVAAVEATTFQHARERFQATDKIKEQIRRSVQSLETWVQKELDKTAKTPLVTKQWVEKEVDQTTTQVMTEIEHMKKTLHVASSTCATMEWVKKELDKTTAHVASEIDALKENNGKRMNDGDQRRIVTSLQNEVSKDTASSSFPVLVISPPTRKKTLQVVPPKSNLKQEGATKQKVFLSPKTKQETHQKLSPKNSKEKKLKKQQGTPTRSSSKPKALAKKSPNTRKTKSDEGLRSPDNKLRRVVSEEHATTTPKKEPCEAASSIPEKVTPTLNSTPSREKESALKNKSAESLVALSSSSSVETHSAPLLNSPLSSFLKDNEDVLADDKSTALSTNPLAMPTRNTSETTKETVETATLATVSPVESSIPLSKSSSKAPHPSSVPSFSDNGKPKQTMDSAHLSTQKHKVGSTLAWSVGAQIVATEKSDDSTTSLSLPAKVKSAESQVSPSKTRDRPLLETQSSPSVLPLVENDPESPAMPPAEEALSQPSPQSAIENELTPSLHSSPKQKSKVASIPSSPSTSSKTALTKTSSPGAKPSVLENVKPSESSGKQSSSVSTTIEKTVHGAILFSSSSPKRTIGKKTSGESTVSPSPSCTKSQKSAEVAERTPPLAIKLPIATIKLADGTAASLSLFPKNQKSAETPINSWGKSSDHDVAGASSLSPAAKLTLSESEKSKESPKNPSSPFSRSTKNQNLKESSAQSALAGDKRTIGKTSSAEILVESSSPSSTPMKQLSRALAETSSCPRTFPSKQETKLADILMRPSAQGNKPAIEKSKSAEDPLAFVSNSSPSFVSPKKAKSAVDRLLSPLKGMHTSDESIKAGEISAAACSSQSEANVKPAEGSALSQGESESQPNANSVSTEGSVASSSFPIVKKAKSANKITPSPLKTKLTIGKSVAPTEGPTTLSSNVSMEKAKPTAMELPSAQGMVLSPSRYNETEVDLEQDPKETTPAEISVISTPLLSISQAATTEAESSEEELRETSHETQSTIPACGSGLSSFPTMRNVKSVGDPPLCEKSVNGKVELGTISAQAPPSVGKELIENGKASPEAKICAPSQEAKQKATGVQDYLSPQPEGAPRKHSTNVPLVDGPKSMKSTATPRIPERLPSNQKKPMEWQARHESDTNVDPTCDIVVCEGRDETPVLSEDKPCACVTTKAAHISEAQAPTKGLHLKQWQPPALMVRERTTDTYDKHKEDNANSSHPPIATDVHLPPDSTPTGTGLGSDEMPDIDRCSDNSSTGVQTLKRAPEPQRSSRKNLVIRPWPPNASMKNNHEPKSACQLQSVAAVVPSEHECPCRPTGDHDMGPVTPNGKGKDPPARTEETNIAVSMNSCSLPKRLEDTEQSAGLPDEGDGFTAKTEHVAGESSNLEAASLEKNNSFSKSDSCFAGAKGTISNQLCGSKEESGEPGCDATSSENERASMENDSAGSLSRDGAEAVSSVDPLPLSPRDSNDGDPNNDSPEGDLQQTADPKPPCIASDALSSADEQQSTRASSVLRQNDRVIDKQSTQINGQCSNADSGTGTPATSRDTCSSDDSNSDSESSSSASEDDQVQVVSIQSVDQSSSSDDSESSSSSNSSIENDHPKRAAILVPIKPEETTREGKGSVNPGEKHGPVANNLLTETNSTNAAADTVLNKAEECSQNTRTSNSATAPEITRDDEDTSSSYRSSSGSGSSSGSESSSESDREDKLVEVDKLKIGDASEVELRRRALALLGVGPSQTTRDASSSCSSGDSDSSSSRTSDFDEESSHVSTEKFPVSILLKPKVERPQAGSRSVSFASILSTLKEIPAWDVEEKIHLFYDKEDIKKFRVDEESRKARKKMKQAFQMRTAIDSLPSFWG